MPIYEFKCEKCNLKFEKIFSKISEKSTEECPECGKPAKRLISRSNFKIAATKSIPKEIDLKVGADAEKRWLEYEDRKSQKEKIKKEFNVDKLSVDADYNYAPITMTKDNEPVSEKEAIKLRKEMYSDYETIRKDPKTKTFKIKQDIEE